MRGLRGHLTWAPKGMETKFSQCKKTARETGVSRHQGGPIEGPPETPRTSQHYRIERIKGVPDLATKWRYSFLSVTNANKANLEEQTAMTGVKIHANLYWLA